MEGDRIPVQDTQDIQSGEPAAVKITFWKRLPMWAWWVIGVVLALLIAAGGYFGYQKYQEHQAYIAMVDSVLNVETFYQGVSIEGVDLSGKTKEEAQKLLTEKEKSIKPKVDVTVTDGDKAFQLDNDALTFSTSMEEVMDEAYQYARDGGRDERYALVRELETAPKDFKVDHSIAVNDKKVEEFVQKVSEELHSDMVEAHVSGFNPDADPMFTYEGGTPGRDVKADELKKSLLAILKSEKREGSVEAPIEETQPTTTVEDVERQTVLISEYSTYSTNNNNGTYNMGLALASANGLVLNPGDTFSFNGTTGDTTTGALGYLPAGAIENNRSVTVYGGGICQAATTIYGAALRADMDITMRYNHRWPSEYVPIGQDATVDYPSTDFQFVNPSEYPVFIKAWLDGRTLMVQIYGYIPDEWDTIDVSSWQTAVYDPPATQYITDNSLPQGTKMLYNNPCHGYRAAGEKIYYKNGAEVKRDPIHSSYYMEGAQVYKVGPNTDPNTARLIDSNGNYVGGAPDPEPPASSATNTTPSSTPPSSSEPSSTPSSKPSSTPASEPSSKPHTPSGGTSTPSNTATSPGSGG